MSIFKYTLPSGRKFVVEGPTGATQAQADYIFYSQVASGSLVGYTQGQTLTSSATRLTKFGLSRLDRGTAGVDYLTILSIVDGALVTATVPNLSKIPLQNPITPADYAQSSQPLGVTPVGPLSPGETQALLAQIINLVDQPANAVSSTNGVGQYGLGPAQLENAGYLKPGTSNYPDFNCVVGTPSVWTGKNGVYSLADVAGDPALQTQIQTAVMNNSYDALTAGGTIQTAPAAPATVSTGQIYTNLGLQTLTAPALIAGTAALSGSLNSLVASAFAGAPNLDKLLSSPVATLDTISSGAVNTITQSIATLGANAQGLANNLVNGTLTSLSSQATGALNSITSGAASTVAGLAGSLTNSVNGAIGGLLTNASQFGSPVTALWAQGAGALNTSLGQLSGLANGALGSVTGALNGALGSATTALNGVLGSAQGAITGALGDLTALASGSLGALGSQAQDLLSSLGGSLDIFGKMSNFSIDFSLFNSDALVSATKVAAGYSNTVNRQTVDAAVTRILGDAKIPVPTFEFPSASSINLAADIQYAQKQLQSLASTAIGQATGAVNTAVSGAITNLLG